MWMLIDSIGDVFKFFVIEYDIIILLAPSADAVAVLGPSYDIRDVISASSTDSLSVF